MADKMILLGLPVMAAAVGPPLAPTPANLEDPTLWAMMMLFGLAGSLFYNRHRLRSRQDYLEAVLAGVMAPALIGLVYGLGSGLMAEHLGLVPGRMVLASASGVLSALGVERWLARADALLSKQLEQRTGHSLDTPKEEVLKHDTQP